MPSYPTPASLPCWQGRDGYELNIQIILVLLMNFFSVTET